MSGFKLKHIHPLSESEISALGYTNYLRKQQGVLNKIQLGIEHQRLNIRHFIYSQPLSHKGLILALLTGDESFLDKETTALFQRFGISHLLAISGPHVLIFAVMLCWLLQKVLNRYWPQIFLKSHDLMHCYCHFVAAYCCIVPLSVLRFLHSVLYSVVFA